MIKLVKTQHDFLFVGKEGDGFVENYAYDLGEGGENSGKIFINLEIQQNSLDAETVGDVIFDTMRKVFFADLDHDPYVRFEDALKEINRSLNVLRQERNSDFLGKLNIIVAAIVDNNLYLTQTGDAEAYLIRRRLSTTISEGLSEPASRDIFTNIASGELEPGDFILLSTMRLMRYISKTDLAKKIHPSLAETHASIKDALAMEVLNKAALIAVYVVESTSMPTSTHQNAHSDGKQTIHLQKEEEYSQPLSTSKNNSSPAEGVSKAVVNLYQKTKIKIDNLIAGNRFETNRDSTRAQRGRRDFSDILAIGNWSKDKLLMAIIVLILILTLGVWWLKAKAEQDMNLKQVDDNLVQIQEQINSAITNGPFNKDLAGKMLNEAEQKAIEIYNSGYAKAKARELLDQILDTRDKLDGVIHPEPVKVADLASKRANVSALGLLMLKGGQLFAYEYNALYPILLDQLQDPLTIDDNEKVISAVNFDDKASLLFYTESGKILEYKDGRVSFIATSDESFKKGAKAIQAYLNKIYLLDTEGNQIWRYTRNRDKFSGAQPYAVNVDLKNGVSLAIDADVYVLNNDGFITKIFQGKKQDFAIKKQPVKPLSSPTKIFTMADMSQIYVLEPTENRVMVYLKDPQGGDATYSGQYVFDDLKGIRDLLVDKETNTMYLLDMTTVYKVKL